MTEQRLSETVDASTVYVRRVALGELPEQLRAEAREGGLDGVYAVHSADGEQVALVGDRDMAFDLARKNDLVPVSVH